MWPAPPEAPDASKAQLPQVAVFFFGGASSSGRADVVHARIRTGVQR
jgi:hypothetical protein